MNEHTTICPQCGAHLRLVRADSFITTESAGLIGRLFARPATHYDHTVEASPWTSDRPTPPTDRSAHLAPGESRSITSYRNLDPTSDVITPTLWALIGGGCIGLTAIPIAVGVHLDWWIPLAAWLGSTTLLFFAAGKRILFDRSLISHEEEHQRAESPPPTSLPQTPYRVSGEIQIGTKTLYTQFGIGDATSWHRFCKAVHAGRNFSGAEAKRHGIDREEFARILALWADPDPQRALVDLGSVGERKTPQLTRGGRAMIRQFAITPPPNSSVDI